MVLTTTSGMKRFFLTAISLFFPLWIHAQDTIVKRNGEQILSKILEISTTEIKYKKFDFQDGPDFIELKSSIKLIKYTNGSKDEFEFQPVTESAKTKENNTDYYNGPVNTTGKIESTGSRYRYKGNRINELEMHDIVLNSNDPEIALLVKRAKISKRMQWLGLICVPVWGVGALSAVLGGFANEPNLVTFGEICGVAGIAFPLISVHFKLRRNAANKEGLRLYNAKF